MMTKRISFLSLALLAAIGAYFSLISPLFNFTLGYVVGLFAQDRNYPLIVFLFLSYAAFCFLAAALCQVVVPESTRKVCIKVLLALILSFAVLSLTIFFGFLHSKDLSFSPKLEYSFFQKNEPVSTSLRHTRIFQPQAVSLLSGIHADKLITLFNPDGNYHCPTIQRNSSSSKTLATIAPPLALSLFTCLFLLILAFLLINFFFLSSSLKFYKYASLLLYLCCSFSIIKNLGAGTLLDPEFVVSLVFLIALLTTLNLPATKDTHKKIYFLCLIAYALFMHWVFAIFIFFKLGALLALYLFPFAVEDQISRKRTLPALGFMAFFFITLHLACWGGGPLLALKYDYTFFEKLSSSDKSFWLTTHEKIAALKPVLKQNNLTIYDIASSGADMPQNILAGNQNLDLRGDLYPVKIFATEECYAGKEHPGNTYYWVGGRLKILEKKKNLTLETAKYHYAGWWLILKKDEQKVFDYAYAIALHKCLSSMNGKTVLLILQDVLKTKNFVIAYTEVL